IGCVLHLSQKINLFKPERKIRMDCPTSIGSILTLYTPHEHRLAIVARELTSDYRPAEYSLKFQQHSLAARRNSDRRIEVIAFASPDGEAPFCFQDSRQICQRL